ncbi:paraquat-inducible protein A [Roseovarius sp. 22II1-1F6A]|nr:paraquat-inducible protein A [Roseovarius sp. 22II1-1F6A]
MTRSGPPLAETRAEDLMACTECDALYRNGTPANGQRAVCARCGHVLAAPRRKAGMQIIMLAVTVLVLAIGAAFFPFLRIEAAGLGNSVSLIDAILVFTGGRLAILAVAMAAFVLVIPAARMLLLIYVIGPLVFDRPPARQARRAYRLAEKLRPWSMAEIFAIGCAVSLVKVADLARVEFGPAFWMFAALVVIALIQERFICSWSVWHSLNTSTGR